MTSQPKTEILMYILLRGFMATRKSNETSPSTVGQLGVQVSLEKKSSFKRSSRIRGLFRECDQAIGHPRKQRVLEEYSHEFYLETGRQRRFTHWE